MKIKSSIILFFILFICFTSTAQSKKQLRKDYNKSVKAFKKNNYSTGIYLGNKALQGALKKKQREKLVKFYRNGISAFHSSTTKRINLYELSIPNQSSTSIKKVELADKVVQEYENLLLTINKVRNTPSGILEELNFDDVILTDYSDALENSKNEFENIKDAFVAKQYEMGEANLRSGTKKFAYNAYHNFKNVIKYDKEYKNVIEKQKEARKLATYTIAISHVYNKIPGMTGNKNLAIDCEREFRLQLNSMFKSHLFVEVISNLSTADFVFSLSLLNNEYQLDRVTSEKKEKTKEVVIKEEKIKKENGEEEVIKIKETVKGTYTTYFQKAWYNVKGTITIINQLQSNETLELPITGFSSDEIVWYRFKGDDRVLDKYEKRNLKDALPNLKTESSLLYDAISNIVSVGVGNTNKQLQTYFN